MKFQNMLLLLSSSSLALTTAQECPKTTIRVGGSSAVEPLAATWIAAYNDVCNKTVFDLEQCGSSCKSRHVCSKGTGADKTLDVSDMSRTWRASEATTENGFIYDCVGSDRKVIQVQVANDAVAFAVATDGVAGECISILGGLTLHQLRWIYSSYNRTQLLATGWDPKSIQNDDLLDTTHLWSELHPDCAKEEILIAGGAKDSRPLTHFKEELLKDDEHVPFSGRRAGNLTVGYYHSSNHEVLNQYVRKNSAAITFFPYSFAVGVADGLTIVSIQNRFGEMVRPEISSISSGDYEPFTSSLYMNVVNEDRVLNAMRPFFEYAFSDEGSLLVSPQGFIPLGDWQKTVMLTALNAGGVSLKDVKCGTQSGTFAIGGSKLTFPVAKMWAQIYMDKCSKVKIFYEGGGSMHGADRVCAASNFSRVDIGTMSRDFTVSEASISDAATKNGYTFGCVGSDREVIQLETAIDGLSIAVQKGGIAETCINKLGGLTIDQLRWMFTNLGENHLRDQGWNDDAVPNSDGDPVTKYWSELLDDPACASEQIHIFGPEPLTYAYDFFQTVVLSAYAEGETFATGRLNGKNTTHRYISYTTEKGLASFLSNNGVAIGFFAYSYSFIHDPDVVTVPIANDAGKFVAPSATTVEDGSYNPLSRKLYFNLVDNRASLALTRPFMEFALSPVGQALVRKVGYAPLAESRRVAMASRASGQPPADGGGLSAGAIFGIVVAVVVVVVGLAFVLMRKKKAREHGKDVVMTNTYVDDGGDTPPLEDVQDFT